MPTPADRLRAARAQKGIKTATEAARRLNMNPVSYQNYEDGSRGFDRHLIKFANFYGVRAQWLKDGKLPMMTSDLDVLFARLNPVDQEKAIEYIEMLARKPK